MRLARFVARANQHHRCTALEIQVPVRRQQLIDLYSRANARFNATAETAQTFNGGPKDDERMYQAYDNRAQGQYDIVAMLQQFITDMDNVGAWES